MEGTMDRNALVIFMFWMWVNQCAEMVSTREATGLWTKREVTNPVPCWSHSSTLVGGWLYIFGGNEAGPNINDLKVVDLAAVVRGDKASWIKRPCTGIAPTPRGYHSAVYCDSRIFVIGGYDGSQCYSETFILDLGTYAA
eukprot:TRINITY_DN338_c1_g1_i2.p2 TRINITY_DN338_c1_g1~~TRINITY_DN338_c1_g1_i2.p2  ORF type:complete len:140 (-),score=15.27 TRINITY_DN338_c1_g1_i2:45-464(-)